MLGYYAQYTALGNLMGLQSDGQMILQAGMGLHGYEPRVNTLFGFPRGISPGGVVFDLPIARTLIVDGLDRQANADFSQQIGLLSSALEHATPEQMFSTEDQPADAISAVKALSKANAQGQRIYQMTRDNMASTLPNLNLATETESEIRTALNAGLTVIAHTDNVSVPGWSGAGYIIFNPDTGDGAYKISGGQNGGFSFILGFSVGMLLIGLLIAGLPAITSVTELAAAIQASLGVNGAFLSTLALDLEGGFDFRCFASGLLWGLLTIGLFAAATGVGAIAILSVVLTALGFVSAVSTNLPTPLECFGL